MFNIGMGELFFIILLVLVVVGPERLPGIMREIGKYIYKIRKIVNELTDQFADELRPIQELQQLADDINPVKQVSKIAMSVAEPLQQASNDVTTAGKSIAGGVQLVKPDAPPASSPSPADAPQPEANAAATASQPQTEPQSAPVEPTSPDNAP